jgi:hypothetical protein
MAAEGDHDTTRRYCIIAPETPPSSFFQPPLPASLLGQHHNSLVSPEHRNPKLSDDGHWDTEYPPSRSRARAARMEGVARQLAPRRHGLRRAACSFQDRE